jgi:hypothetical protein
MCFPLAQWSIRIGDALFTRAVKWKSRIEDLAGAGSSARGGGTRAGVRLAPAERLEDDLVFVLVLFRLSRDAVQLQENVVRHRLSP